MIKFLFQKVFHSPLKSLLPVMTLCYMGTGCSSSAFLAEDERLLADVEIKNDTKIQFNLPLTQSLKQHPNSKWFNLTKAPLGIYCMAGHNQGKVAKWLRRMGEAPVVYDSLKTKESCDVLQQILINKGYRQAKVKTETKTKKHKLYLTYNITSGPQSYIKQINYTADAPHMLEVLDSLKAKAVMRPGMPLDISLISSQRSYLVNQLRDKGYYKINNKYITFTIDTLSESQETYVHIHLKKPLDADTAFAYSPFMIRNVQLYEDPEQGNTPYTSTVQGITYHHNKHKSSIRRRVYNRLIATQPNTPYTESKITATYQAINTLPAISYSNATPTLSDTSAHVDYTIYAHLATPRAIAFELEGTNTAGDLGAAASATYTHRNIFRGAEQFQLKLRGAYEAITQLEGYNNENYIEYSVEGKLNTPSMNVPVLSLFKKFKDMRLTHRASSEFNVLYNSQRRPEFHRKLLTVGYSYNWKKNKQERLHHRWDVMSLNYMFMPWISSTFRKNYLEVDDPRYGILRYTYEDIFIMRTGYSFVYNSNKISPNGTYQTNAFQLKGGFETAGNLLNLTRNIIGAELQPDGTHKIFNIPYSQYAKFDLDFVKSTIINPESSIAFHAALGFALPYGNSTVLPYEKRYFAGGANSVRGWSVRELGPGTYKGTDGKIDFINQTGNLKIDLSVEYRTHLFGMFHGAFFIDAGNIWNTKTSLSINGETFSFDTFHREFAVAYGLGLRLNLGYFLLRLDGGMKAINPAYAHGKGHYPIINHKFSRDFTFHFAVGLPY